MKPFEDYLPKETEYPDRYAYTKVLLDEIDSTPMTAADRALAIKGVSERVNKWFREQVKPYNNESRRLEGEFWCDCRADLGYDEFLNEDGCQELEHYAWQEGHSSGFPEVYNVLCELAVLAERLVKNRKKHT